MYILCLYFFMSEQIKLATFKINGDRWTEFVSKAAARNTSASALLKGFIDRYLDGIDPEAIAPTSNVSSQIEQALAPIRQEVEELWGKVEGLSILGNQAQEPKAQGNSRRKDKALVGNSERGNSERGSIRPHLTIAQAYELARQRGYTSLRNSFKDWSSRNPDDCEVKYGLRRFSGTQGVKGELVFADIASLPIEP